MIPFSSSNSAMPHSFFQVVTWHFYQTRTRAYNYIKALARRYPVASSSRIKHYHACLTSIPGVLFSKNKQKTLFYMVNPKMRISAS